MVFYIVRRIGSILVTFFLVSVLIFGLMRAMPGGPFDEDKMPLSEAARAKLRVQYGLDGPLHMQYLNYMWGVLRLDFGIPYQSPAETVTDVLARAWPPSFVLGGLGVLLGTPIGILLGTAAALRRNSLVDYSASVLSTLGITVPIYVVALMLMLVFGVWLDWLPTQGWGSPVAWILPVTAYAVGSVATFARFTRSSMLDVLNQPFVTVLRAKGLSEGRIVFRHVLKNAAIPVVTIFFPTFILTATGSIFVEKMFRVPGLGQYFVSSLEKRDYPMEMALVMILTLLVGVAYLVTDIAYVLLNPRVRVQNDDR
jgi:ABC-type dipeptide/oligopeptide/nickel transport system permease component